MATLEQEFIDAAVEMLTGDFGPSELPSSNQPATFTTTLNTGYRETSETTETADYCLRWDYTSREVSNNSSIRSTDTRFIVLASTLTSVPDSGRVEITWGGRIYTIIQTEDVNNVVYVMQARPK